MTKNSGVGGALQMKTSNGKFAGERQKLAERLAELDRLERQEDERARAESAQNLAEAFTRHGVVISGKRDANRLAKVIASVGVEDVLSRLEGKPGAPGV